MIRIVCNSKVRPYLDDLVQSGYRISKKLYDGTLERAGE
jgi:predicted nucleic acid-binding protein